MNLLGHERVFVIAEAGVNHNGNVDLALKLIDVAADAGADAVKFQTFVAERLVTREAKQAGYQVRNIGSEESQFSMLKKLELSFAAHQILAERCRLRDIRFMSTAFDDESIALLRSLECVPWKIPSGEITNLPYLRHVGAFAEETILSTGMATLGEVEAALNALVRAGTPREKITLLHCTTEYPAPFEEVNLRAMVTMGNAFKLQVGYSDHTQGIEVAIAAVALGARVIEKHFTLDKEFPGPDHKASLDPLELSAMVRAIRNIELALGDGRKVPSPSELKNRRPARKSIVAAMPIKTGEKFTSGNCTTTRPGTGVDPMRWDELVGRVAVRDYAADELIEI